MLGVSTVNMTTSFKILTRTCTEVQKNLLVCVKLVQCFLQEPQRVCSVTLVLGKKKEVEQCSRGTYSTSRNTRCVEQTSKQLARDRLVLVARHLRQP